MEHQLEIHPYYLYPYHYHTPRDVSRLWFVMTKGMFHRSTKAIPIYAEDVLISSRRLKRDIVYAKSQ